MKFPRLSIALLLIPPFVACGSSDDEGPATTSSAATACSRTCTKVVAAGCQNDTLDACISDCEEMEKKIPTNCASNYDALVSCIELSSSPTCGTDGKAKLSGCDLMQNTLMACLQGGTGGQGGSAGAGGQGGSSGHGVGGAGGAGGSEPITDITDSLECQQYCDAMASECGLTCDPSFDCAIDSGQCADSQKTYLACVAMTGTWYCGTDGFSIVSSCKKDSSVCPEPPPVSVTCDPESGDQACDTCAKSSCCPEYRELFGNADTPALFDCIESCPTSGCLTICQHDYPKAWNALVMLDECLTAHCYSSC